MSFMNLKEEVLKTGFASKLRAARVDGTLSMILPELAMMESKVRGHKDNVEHSIQVMENAREFAMNKNDYILLTAALFHDVGKPDTLSFESGKVTFRNHEIVGARLTRKFLSKYGFNNDEIKQVTVLIREHMRGHVNISDWSDSGLRRLAVDLGSNEQVERIAIIYASDCTSKYKSNRERSRVNAFAIRDRIIEIRIADALKARRPVIDGNTLMSVTGLSQGRELGSIMRFLNTDEGLALTEDNVFQVLQVKFPEYTFEKDGVK